MLVNDGLLWMLIVTAFVVDVLYCKIPNWLTSSAVLLGIVYHTVLHGWIGIGQAMLGCVIGGGLLMVMYTMRAVGAGDVKLFAAIGAISGWSFTVTTLFYAVLIAGLIGCLILLCRRELVSRLMKSIFMVQWWTQKIRKYLQRAGASMNTSGTANDGMLRFPFMLAVLPGVLIAKLHSIPGVVF